MTKIGRKKPEGERFLRAGAVAALLGVSRRRVSDLAAAGRLPTTQFTDGANYRFRLQDVMGLVRKRGVEVQGAIEGAKEKVLEASKAAYRTRYNSTPDGTDNFTLWMDATEALINAEVEGLLVPILEKE